MSRRPPQRFCKRSKLSPSATLKFREEWTKWPVAPRKLCNTVRETSAGQRQTSTIGPRSYVPCVHDRKFYEELLFTQTGTLIVLR